LSGDDFRQFFQRITGEIVAIAVSHAVELLPDRLIHLGMCVTKTEHRWSSRPIEIVLSVDIEKTASPAIGNLGEAPIGYFTMSRLRKVVREAIHRHRLSMWPVIASGRAKRRQIRLNTGAFRSIGPVGQPRKNASMRLLVLQHCPVTPVGLVGERAIERGAELVTQFPHDGDRVPTNTNGFDGLIVLGGPMHAGDDATYPAFSPMLSLIRACGRAKVPVLGLCLGAQLIARAFGQKVYRFGGLEVGYPIVHLTPDGESDPLFRAMAREQRVMQMHEDSFGLPEDAALLMRNDTCENQAFRIGPSIYGIQAHPEVTFKDARNFPRDCWPAMTRHYGDEAEAVERRVLSEIDAHFEAGAAFCRTMTDRWLDLAMAAKAGRKRVNSRADMQLEPEQASVGRHCR
jgi:GMP synthase (glutamine-hydrolysing)